MTNPTTALPPPLFHPPSSSSPSFSSVPDEIVVNCLARISKSHYRSLCSVSKSFYSLLSSQEIYAARSQIGATEPRLYVCLWLPTDTNHHSWFTLGEIEAELSLVPVRLSSSYSPARLNSTSVAVGSEIYQIGGTNKDKRSKAVRALDCRSRAWRRAPNLTVARKHAKSCLLDEKIYVMGGCRKTQTWGEVFDLKTQTWKPLPKPPSDDDVHSNHKVAVFGARLHVFTKNNNHYAYDPKQGKWVPEVGFVGLEPISITGPWCVIEDVMFAEYDRKYKWYNPRYGKWLIVYGLNDVYASRGYNYCTIQLVNHGGKLVIIWDEWVGLRSQNKRIWCAVIRLEEHATLLGPQIWGVVERCVVVLTVPKSYKLSSCQSVSV